MNNPSISRRTALVGVALAGVTATAGIGAVVTAEGVATHATATIVDTTGARVGFATFTEDATGVLHVNVKVGGLSEGEHGIHIHAVGVCATPDFLSAGGHHNPLGGPHGAHAGDLPNLVVNPAGRGTLTGTTDDASLSAGAVSVFDSDGSAIVIHALPDDFVTQPTGGSGARVACGVIVPD